MGDLDGSVGAGWFAWRFFVVWLGALGFFGVQVRRAHRFLRAHQEPTAG